MEYKKLFKARSNVHGHGCFAGQEIKRRELIAHWFDDAKEISGKQLMRKIHDPFTYQTAIKFIGDIYLMGKGNRLDAMDFINHSNKPNVLYFAGMLFALKKIKIGQELFIDYRLLNHENQLDVVKGRIDSLEIQINQLKQLFRW